MESLEKLYTKLFEHFGPQKWWPADSDFEMMIGALLTQNVNWKNVETAIDRLKSEGILDPKSILRTEDTILQELIRATGFYRQKTARIKELASAIIDAGGVETFLNTDNLRRRLLEIHGIGPETADSIALYAGNRPCFVVDAYTMRILKRRYGIEGDYDSIQERFQRVLKRDVKLYQEYHALLVKFAKDICRVKPLCVKCPISYDCEHFNRR